MHGRKVVPGISIDREVVSRFRLQASLYGNRLDPGQKRRGFPAEAFASRSKDDPDAQLGRTQRSFAELSDR
jgi:hypothetical protein